MRAPVLFVALGMAAFGLARAESPPLLELRQAAIEPLRSDGEFALRATLHRAPESESLHEDGEFSLLGKAQALGVGPCGDVIFRDGFDP